MWLRLGALCLFLSCALSATDLLDLAFMSGHWRGDAGGKQIEEIWNAPESGSLTGMYREMQDGKTTFYEFLTIEAASNGPVLRIEHYDAGLKGWEEKNKPATFHIKNYLPEGEVVFESNDSANPLLLTYSRTSKNTMDVLLERRRDGKWVKQTYKYTREKT